MLNVTKTPRIITISGEVSTGKSTLAKSIIKFLPNWQIVNTGQLFRNFLQERGDSILAVSNLPDSVHRDFDHIQKKILETQSQHIVEGRLSGYLSQEYHDIFKVLCVTEMPTRVQRYQQRELCDAQTALNEINFRDQRDVQKYQEVYNLNDYRDPKFYDLILDCTVKAPDELAQVVLEKIGLKQIN